MLMSAADRAGRIDRYERGPLRLRGALGLVPDGAVTWRPGPEKWSAHEIVCHCADAEVNGAARLRFLVAEKEPVLAAYDQDHWARVFDYHALPLQPALETILAVRAHTSGLLRVLPGEAWAREGRHTERGAYSVSDWLRTYADHLENHARQIERNVEAWRARTDQGRIG
jgi:hypothetical protein